MKQKGTMNESNYIIHTYAEKRNREITEKQNKKKQQQTC